MCFTDGPTSLKSSSCQGRLGRSFTDCTTREAFVAGLRSATRGSGVTSKQPGGADRDMCSAGGIAEWGSRVDSFAILTRPILFSFFFSFCFDLGCIVRGCVCVGFQIKGVPGISRSEAASFAHHRQRAMFRMFNKPSCTPCRCPMATLDAASLNLRAPLLLLH